MPPPSIPGDAARLAAFNVVSARNPVEFERRMREGTPFPANSRSYKYRLLDPVLNRTRFDRPILSLAIRSTPSIVACHGGSRLPTEVLHEGEDSAFIGFTTVLAGEMAVIEGNLSKRGNADTGLVFRLRHQTRMLTDEESTRTHLSFKVTELESALEHMLDARLGAPLEFETEIDWSHGLAASLKWQLAFLMQEFERPDGVVGNAVALASMTDFLLTLALRAAPNNYSGQLALGPAVALPAYIRRAEEFMRAHCATPLRIAEVAAAAGCSVRTLNAVFQRFRGQVPLAALQAIRLQKVHAELSHGGEGESIGVVARRYGFTNSSRFHQAFQRRFGETALDVIRRRSRL
ncbi:helix-turn-helix domain-containing protein [Sediminicoccus sp. KRV36]|uniref:helix-turn-helix transcriptional regulator n=1 Tax=Sediminicoccus sp. KRV36 TaxID=3133721 RepID=UPI00200C1674|nr:helix-turn-helix domain-containing protein [Sediminicoccus rosea]UPY37869.1 AraC family transcriptional regulator [Sediminicoccus rosea]